MSLLRIAGLKMSSGILPVEAAAPQNNSIYLLRMAVKQCEIWFSVDKNLLNEST